MDAKMSSGDRPPRPAQANAASKRSARTAGPRDNRRTWFFSALFVFLLITIVAYKQPLRPNPFTPVEAFTTNWWLYPLETNAYKRAPLITADLRSVCTLPHSKKVWAVGSGGFILHSEDGGETWQRQVIGADTSSRSAASNTFPRSISAASVLGFDFEADKEKNPKQAKSDSGVRQVPLNSAAQQFNLQSKANAANRTRGSSEKKQTKIRPDTSKKSNTTPLVRPQQKTDYSTVTLRSVQFIDEQHGWIVGDAGVILRTQDGGAHWEEEASPWVEDLYTNQFVDTSTGWAFGMSGNIFYTSDGGRSWTAPSYDLRTFEDLSRFQWIESVHFADVNNGWVVGGNQNFAQHGAIMSTTDGGKNWRTQSTSPAILHSIHFITPQSGWAVGDSGTILATTDAGRTWISQTSMKRNNFHSVFFADSAAGWAVGDTACIMSTLDGGRTWRAESTGTSSWLYSVCFSDRNNGWAVGSGGAILATTDGGQTWHQQVNGRVGYYYRVNFVDEQHGWIVGDYGRIMATADGGKTWDCQNSGTITTLDAVSFTDRSIGRVLGEDGTILASLDGGQNWQLQTRFLQRSLFLDIHFVNPNIGWLLAPYMLYGTTDGGQSWHILDNSKLIRSISFINADTGWAVAQDSICRTNDGGYTWHGQEHPSNDAFIAVQFVDSLHGWAVGDRGKILATSNGGIKWQQQTSRVPVSFGSVDFVDSANGWVVGDSGTIVATNDGGRGWRSQVSATSRRLYSVDFVNSTHGWCVGEHGTLLATTNGGQTWEDPTQPPSRALAPWYYLALGIVGLMFIPVSRAPKPIEVTQESVADVLISDRPLNASDPDPLDFKVIASGLSRFLRNENTVPPLTIAVTGAWGSGKSSLMNLLKADLQRYGFRPVWFNAWHHQKEEHLLAALLENVRKQAIPPWWRPEAVLFRSKLFWKRVRRYWPVSLVLMTSLSFVVGYFATDYHTRMINAIEFLGKVGETNGGIVQWLQTKLFEMTGHTPTLTIFASLSASLLVGWRWVRAFGVSPVKLMASMSGKFNFRDLKEQVGFRTRFAQEFSEVTAALNPRTMLILIDDLDRCQPKNVLEVLEAVNFLISSGDCFVVMGLDLERVERCVGLGFKDVAEELIDGNEGKTSTSDSDGKLRRAQFAKQYLEKLINIEVPVPIPTPTQSQKLIGADGVEKEYDSSLWTRLRKRAPRIGKRTLAGAFIVTAFIGAFLLGKNLFHDSETQNRLPLAVQQSTGQEPVGSPAGSISQSQQNNSSIPESSQQGDRAVNRQRPNMEEFRSPIVPTVSSTIIFIIAAFLLALGAWRLSIPSDFIVMDSPEFIDAMKIWHPLLVAKCNTPRSIKRFINRVRYFAMQEESKQSGDTLLQRINRMLRRELKRTDGADRQQRSIPESILVALSAVQHVDIALLKSLCDQNIQKGTPKLETSLKEAQEIQVITAAFLGAAQHHLERFKNLPVAPEFQERYEKVSRGIRIN